MSKVIEEIKAAFVGQWVQIASPRILCPVMAKCVDVFAEGDLVAFRMQSNAVYRLQLTEVFPSSCVGFVGELAHEIKLTPDLHQSWKDGVNARDSILQHFDIKNCSDPEVVAQQKARASRIKWEIRMHHMVGSDSMGDRLNRNLPVKCFHSQVVIDLEYNRYFISDEIMAAYERCNYPLQ